MFNLFNKKKLPCIAKKWLPYFYQFNIREKHFWLEKDRLREKFSNNPKSIKNKYGIEPRDNDVIWSIFNAILQTRKSDEESAQVFYRMADFLQDDEGKIGQAKIFRHRGNILQFKGSGVVNGVEVVACNDSCKKCKKIRGKKYTLDEAWKKMPLPVKICTHKYGCRCIYKSVEKMT